MSKQKPKRPIILNINNIEVVYSDVILVLKGVSLALTEGEIVCLLGTNGAGKTTTLKAVSGLLKPDNGEIRDGNIQYLGEDIQKKDAEDVVRMGIVQVLEGRRIFKHLTVEENLRVGTVTRSDKEVGKDMETVYTYFPILANLKHHLAGYSSGGEQQMLAIGRALMARPKLMLLDEPSLGLSPLLVQEIFRIITKINQDQGTSVLLVEQNAAMALKISHYGFVMENGKIVLAGNPREIEDNPDVKEFYLGMMESGRRKSYKEVKSYKRRKRWL
ncbi:MAG: ABC transporter ATP-binding protein [Deltaproteobacteria bacterium]|nr:ABC transporter ATP-binding protein [Deltaproteobacteria bacterium]MBW1941770.1 ABC transporter ATP-binding protein [Deltaproteobacteria bacterium]